MKKLIKLFKSSGLFSKDVWLFHAILTLYVVFFMTLAVHGFPLSGTFEFMLIYLCIATCFICTSNIHYWIVAKYKGLIRRLYRYHFGDDKIDSMLYKVSQCPECYLNNSAECCGCDFKSMIISDKKCGYGKW